MSSGLTTIVQASPHRAVKKMGSSVGSGSLQPISACLTVPRTAACAQLISEESTEWMSPGEANQCVVSPDVLRWT